MSFSFADPRRPRRPSLTPMIDVVFLLMVFFMLAARFGQDGAVPLSLAGGGEGWTGPPRLVDVSPEGVRLNGVAMAPGDLREGLSRLTDGPGDPVVLRPADGASLQRLMQVVADLRAAGHAALVLVEAE